MFASRTEWDLRPNKIAQEVQRLHKTGAALLDLTQSNPTACNIAYPSGLLESLAKKSSLRYEPAPLGLRGAREAIAREYQRQGIRLNPDHIVLTASTSEAYSFILRLLVNPGERVLFPSPSYPLLDHLAQLNDVGVDRYFLRYDGSWYVDVESIQRALTKDTRAIVVINPNNPTGSFLKYEEWSNLAEICKAHDLALISDEVFRDYAYGPKDACASSLLTCPGVLTFSLGGISKMLGLPQMKLAWICVSGPASLRKEAMKRLEMIADTYLSVNTPVQHALPEWLKHKDRFRGVITRRVLENRRFLESQPWEDHGCRVLSAEAGWYGVLQVPSTKSEEDWVLGLLQNQHVLVHPGYFFDFEKEAYLVLSLLPQPRLFAKAIGRILMATVSA